MPGETNLATLLKTMKPELNEGDYVFCTFPLPGTINLADIICSFKEQEGLTIIVEKRIADKLNFNYTYIAAWITLTIHSSLEAAGLTAAFAAALAKQGIGCNVVAAYHHDHIFVAKNDAAKAIKALEDLAINS